jgi:hypothetical protein
VDVQILHLVAGQTLLLAVLVVRQEIFLILVFVSLHARRRVDLEQGVAQMTLHLLHFEAQYATSAVQEA